MSNADNSGNNYEETYHNVPDSQYFYISREKGRGIAVHKGFFKLWTVILCLIIGVSTAILCLTNWWQTLTVTLLTFIYIKNWVIGFPATFVAIGIFYVWYGRRKKRLLRERNERLRIRRFQDALINQDLGVKNRNDEKH
jgi:hypothetical protein